MNRDQLSQFWNFLKNKSPGHGERTENGGDIVSWVSLRQDPEDTESEAFPPWTPGRPGRPGPGMPRREQIILGGGTE